MIDKGKQESSGASPAKPSSGGGSKPRMIAIEEAFATREFLDHLLKSAASSPYEGVRYAAMVMSRPAVADRLTSIDVRLADMDAHGVDMHVVALSSPGVQVFEPKFATALATKVNDELAGWKRKYPKRFACLAAIAPQDPKAAAEEIDRAIGDLGLNGIIINSHTNGEFLDDPKFWPILEAAVKHRAAIYLHPTFPSPAMVKPYERYGMHGAVWGFAAECGLHAMRMVLGGVFDHFPELQIVLGHGAEGLPYWFYRMDLVHTATMAFASQPPGMVHLKRKPSEYVKSNIHLATSGMCWDDVLLFGIKAMGVERVMFAIDYPYESSKVAADFIRNAPLSEKDRALVLSGNAERLFKIAT